MEREGTRELIKKYKLKNNLDLVIFFYCRHTAGDRYQITFEAEIDIEIKEEFFNRKALNGVDIKDVRTLLGNRTSYKYSKTRNFIADNEKDKIFEEMKQQFLENNRSYISSPSFPEKLIKRNYVLAQKEEIIRLQRAAFFYDNK